MFTSNEILAMDDLYDLQEMDVIEYQLTKDELQWVDFIRGRYAIADYIDNNTIEDVLTIDPIEVSKVLDMDCMGYGKAVMLSDDSALQNIFFWIYIENY